MRKQHTLNVLILTVIAVIFLFLNFCQPIFADDFGRLSASALTRGDLFSTIYNQYFRWTGRVSAEFLAYFLLNKDHLIVSLFFVDVINSIIFSIFTVFSFKLVTRDKYELSSKQFVCFLFFFCFIFLYSGVIGNALWKTAAIQYFWGVVLLVGYYYFIFNKQKSSIIFSLFTGLFIGLYNEIYVGVLVVLAIAYFLERKLNNKPINKDIIYFFVALVVGGVILAAAPGNYKRLDVLAGSRDIGLLQNIHFMWQLLMYHPYAKLLHYMIAVIALLLLVDKDINIKSKVVYFVALVVSLFVLAPVVGQYGGLNQRVLMIYYVLFFLVILDLVYRSKNIFVVRLVEIFSKLFWLLGIVLAFQLSQVFAAYISLHNYESQRQQLIGYYHQHDIKDASFPINYNALLDTSYKFIYFDDITPLKSDWRNKGFASYYDFDSVVLTIPHKTK
ncbi:hypothetical protein LO80_06685 [Candidatus Francisella endociliophora]|uniref:Glycosyltransferase RgtA/B/C/D-like domain-containing protein n=1 Tax=Candidatus Francisella endociliophora TaxID=653937 RepID=A0A097EQ28_9GAMM|nr:DUF6056 family protein [Francisella sp. FSC1006]AIT09679.1 hypothetical protein LO80_06685 [Francisella sp. FSC1006]